MIHAKLKDIRNALVARMEAQDLGVTNIVVGYKARSGAFTPPMVWIMPIASSISDDTMTIGETWRLRFVIIGVVADHDPVQGMDKAEELAIKASGAVMLDGATENRRLPVEGVADIIRESFEPVESRIVSEQESLYGAGVQIAIRFHNTEVM